MFSSTELVRKNKYIFDKLNKNEIEKAIILRDGKPGIILLDFNIYEQIMAEYLSLKNVNSDYSTQKIKVDKRENKVIPNNLNNIDELSIKKQSKEDNVEELEFSFDTDLAKDKAEPLKEFWD